MPALFVDAERLRDLNSGLGQVCLHLGHELVQQRPNDWTVTFLVPKGKSGMFGDSVQYVEASWKRKIWMADRYDVWHCLHQDSTYVSRRSKLVLTIHDLNFLERADYSPDQKAKKLAALQCKVDQASAITAISAYTASVVQQHLRLSNNQPLRIIHNGNALAATRERAPEIDASQRIEQPFFLFMGVIHPKKNVHTLLPLLEAFPDYRLVLAGPDQHPYARHILEQAEKLGTADRLVMPGPIDEATKRWLYANCEAFLFPSLAEGFGLPVAEAMAFGKPVFISRLTSLPEIGGKEAYYFDNFEPEHMAETIHNGLTDFEQNPLRQERLRRRVANFSWPNAAGEYWKLYNELVRSSPAGF
ncbi:glycosyltransferase family 4 protein [Spirosoma pomorum]